MSLSTTHIIFFLIAQACICILCLARYYIYFCGCSLALTSTGPMGLWFLCVYIPEHMKAQPAVVPV